MRNDILYPLRRFHGWLHEYPVYRANRKALQRSLIPELIQKLKEMPNAVFLVMTPEHRNLGDHAIASAEQQMLRQIGLPFIEVPDTQLNALTRSRLLSVMDGHPIIINGGGNMGTLWFDAEQTHRNIIRNNPHSPIFIFPNTIFYEDSDWGQKEFKKSIRIYNRHRNLHLYAREEVSCAVMKDAYKNVSLVPDVVLSMDKSGRDLHRRGCLICLRNDTERTLTTEQQQEVIATAHELFTDLVQHTDMVAPEPIPASQREEALERKYDEFSRAELVITDRLHGMILCAITGTPCIVLGSKSPKVKGCYDWLRGLGYICYADQISDIPQLYRQIPKKTYRYHNEHLIPYFQKMKEDLQTNSRGGDDR